MRANNSVLLLIVVTVILFAASAGFAAESGQTPSGKGAASLSAPSVSHSSGKLKSTFGERSAAAGVEPRLDSRALKVLTLIEKKTGDQRVLSHISYKLSSVSEGRLRMIASLSDRILSHEREAEAEVAFLLLSALIVFS